MDFFRRAIERGFYLLDVAATDLHGVLQTALDHLIAKGVVPTELRDPLLAALLEREQQGSTAIGHAVAVPHAYLASLSASIVLFVRLQKPINLEAPDGLPTQFFFVLLGHPDSAAEHLDTLAAIARLMSDEPVRFQLRRARSGAELIEALDEFERRTAPPPEVPPAVPEALRYTGRPFGGLLADIRRRLPHYASDFRDGLHIKCLASTLFLFFACVAPAVTFGGVMAELTDQQIGAVEMLVASAFCGVVYALLAGQPLIILGGTGPLLIFTAMLYEWCVRLNLAFLPARAWVGLWAAFFLILLAATDASCLMRYFTRFTDEIFAVLIAIIFIYASIKAIANIFIAAYRQEGVGHDTAFLSLLLAIGTYYIAANLSRFRKSRYLLSWMREFLSDFGPAIALSLMAAVALWFHGTVSLERLAVPDSFQPTVERAWLIDLTNVPVWSWLAAAVPGALVAVLAFMDQNITARLVNSPANKLRKGATYHMDLAIIGVLIGVCSLFGLPWLVAATVRSLNHLRSLATVEEYVAPGGETRERIIGVRENRLTGLAIHLLMGLSLLLLPVLKLIPMPVLYGLFLFMGVISLAGNQFFERLTLWAMDPALYPATHYIRRVPVRIIHAFTFIQLICLGMLAVLELTPFGILFPLLIALLVPVRLAIGRLFQSEYLAALDADEVPEEEEEQWV